MFNQKVFTKKKVVHHGKQFATALTAASGDSNTMKGIFSWHWRLGCQLCVSVGRTSCCLHKTSCSNVRPSNVTWYDFKQINQWNWVMNANPWCFSLSLLVSRKSWLSTVQYSSFYSDFDSCCCGCRKILSVIHRVWCSCSCLHQVKLPHRKKFENTGWCQSQDILTHSCCCTKQVVVCSRCKKIHQARLSQSG